nr:hypothetical protein [Sphingomonas sp. KC8]
MPTPIHNQAHVRHKPRLLSDNGLIYIAGELAEYLEAQRMILKQVKSVCHISFGRVVGVWKRSAALITMYAGLVISSPHHSIPGSLLCGNQLLRPRQRSASQSPPRSPGSRRSQWRPFP